MRRRKKPDLGVLLDRCLAAFVEAGTLNLSLDKLARKAGSSKRMLVHYFGGRENIEEQAITRLETGHEPARLAVRRATASSLGFRGFASALVFPACGLQ